MSDKDNLDRWTDVFKSVDVIFSTPIYTYDQNGECFLFAGTDNFGTKFIGALDIADSSRSVKKDNIIYPGTVDGQKVMMDRYAGEFF